MKSALGPRLVYLLALLFGAGMVAAVFPAWALMGRLPPGAPPTADFATHVVGQIYFLAAPWHWPVLVAPGLVAPWGVNIAFTDSNPLAAMLAKLLRPALPPFDQVVTLWQALCWLAQPAGAVFALRSAGERRLLPACAIAAMAAAQPAFLAGFWHSSLSTHFALLVMIGWYFRIVRHARPALIGACILLPILLLVHPYLVVMAAAVFAAAPLTLFLRHDRAWLGAAAALAASCACVAVLAILFGYTSGKSPGGYGYFSLNLLAPVFPVNAAIIPGYAISDLDATGAQNAGDGYLGLGLLLLILAVFATCRDALRGAFARHGGLALACLALWLIALSNRVTFGKLILFRIHTALGPLEMVRASSRLFWPVAYVALVGAVAILAARKPRLGIVLLPVAALLQLLDASALFAQIYSRLHAPAPWLFDPAAFRAAARASERLVVLPPFGCTQGHDMLLMQPLWLGAERLMPTNTAYVARTVHPQSCDLDLALAQSPQAGDLLVVEPGFRPALLSHPWANGKCGALSEYTLCSQNASVRARLEPLTP